MEENRNSSTDAVRTFLLELCVARSPSFFSSPALVQCLAAKSASSMSEKKKDKKDKKRPSEGGDAKEKKQKLDDDDDAPKKVRLVSPIANPLADKKLTKKVLKGVKAAAGAKLIRRGVKEVVKALKKGEQGLAIIAGDISPVEVICHVPILCEEKNVAYIYVPSKEDLGLASLTKRPTSIVLVKSGADFADTYAECEKEMRAALPKF